MGDKNMKTAKEEEWVINTEVKRIRTDPDTMNVYVLEKHGQNCRKKGV